MKLWALLLNNQNSVLPLGISSISSCGDPDRLPALPAGDEQRLQRAALLLQQKLILREWLKVNRMHHHYPKYKINETYFLKVRHYY